MYSFYRNRLTMVNYSQINPLRDNIQFVLKEKKLSVNGWAIQAGVSEGSLRALLKGRTETLHYSTVKKLAAAVDITPAQLQSGVLKGFSDNAARDYDAQMPLFKTSTEHHVSIPLYAASSDSAWDIRNADKVDVIVMSRESVNLKEKESHNALFFIQADGDTVEPDFSKGDRVLIDGAQTIPQKGHVFLIGSQDGLLLRRLQEEGDIWLAISSREGVPVKMLNKETTRILGRAVMRTIDEML